MYEDKKTYIDFDGVILDSEERILKLKDQHKSLLWPDFFELVNWDILLAESKEINDSLQVINELQNLKREIAILTKIHTLDEGISKIKFMRGKNIIIPIILVPPHVKKSEIIIPNQSTILIDDSVKNISDWENNNGHGILFDNSCDKDDTIKVKSLHFLLK